MVEAQDFREVLGMEDMEVSGPKIPYVKLLNGTAAEKVDLPAGTIVTGSKETLEVLTAKGDVFKFVPIKYYTDWSVWDPKTRSLIKRSFDKKVWSDGTRVTYEEVGLPTGAWYNNTAPTAVKGYNLVIYPLTELAKEEPKFMILQLAVRNKFIGKTVDTLDRLLKVKVIEEKCSGMFNLVIGLTAEKIEDKGNLWYEWMKPEFLERLDVKFLEAAKAVYSEVKDINKTGTALIPVERHEAEVVYSVPTDVAESTEF